MHMTSINFFLFIANNVDCGYSGDIHRCFSVTSPRLNYPTGIALTLGVIKKTPVAYYSYKNHNFANIGHKNMNDASF